MLHAHLLKRPRHRLLLILLSPVSFERQAFLTDGISIFLFLTVSPTLPLKKGLFERFAILAGKPIHLYNTFKIASIFTIPRL